MISRSVEAMGTVFNFYVDAEGATKEMLSDAIDEAVLVLAHIETRFSLWIHESELSRFRRGEVQEPSSEFDEVMLLCYKALEITGGFFAMHLRIHQIHI